MFGHLDRLVQTSPDGALASVPSTPSPRVVANRLTDRRCFRRRRHRRSPVALESSNCPNVPPVRIQQAPCSPAPARMAYNGLGRLGEPARRTAGALAQAAALHVAARTLAKYPSASAAPTQRARGGRADEMFCARSAMAPRPPRRGRRRPFAGRRPRDAQSNRGLAGDHQHDGPGRRAQRGGRCQKPSPCHGSGRR